MNIKAIMLPEAIPSASRQLLRDTLGQKVKFMCRFEVNDDYFEQTSSSFSDAEGPLVIGFENGVSLGFGYQPSLDSVTVWLERDSAGHEREPSTLNDSDYVSFDVNDATVSPLSALDVPGRIVQGWRLYVSGRSVGAPSEQALVLQLSDRVQVALTYGLPTGSEDFRILPWEVIKPLVNDWQSQQLA